MKINISNNIRRLRKEHGMLQEQLADALGVSFAAVSKWERGVATPDLGYIVEMAHLFGVSVDVLVGYSMQSGAVADFEQRIKKLQRAKDYERAFAEAEKALIRYPNNFCIVYASATVYQLKGLEHGDKAALERAIELYNRAILLLSQNTEPQVNEVTLRCEIATCCIGLGQKDKALEILKRYNAGGINNSLIALTQLNSDNCNPHEVEQYLVRAYGQTLSETVRVMSGYTIYYSRINNSRGAYDAALWLVNYLKSLKLSDEEVCYVDKLIALFYAACACSVSALGETENAEKYLRLAFDYAQKFDAFPVYNVQGIKFCIGDISMTTASDDVGATAMQAIERLKTQSDWNAEIDSLWNRLKNEQSESGGNVQ